MLCGGLPCLTPVAALGLAVVIVLAMAFHARRREPHGIAVNAVLLALAAFVARVRWGLLLF